MFAKRKGFTLVEIMIVVAIIALLAAIAIPNLLRSRLNAAEANAQATLKTISTAYESYAAANDGSYDISVAELAGTGDKAQDPPYLNEDYEGTFQGYTFNCGASAEESYKCTATARGAFSGKGKTYTVTTGGVMTSADPT